MKPQPRYKPGDRIGGRYQVHKALMGGMGEVYLCLDLEEMYPYALKTFQQWYLQNIQRQRHILEEEVKTWIALENHPNIVRCFLMEFLDSQPFIHLEWIAGTEGCGSDLRGWLRRGSLDLKMSIEIGLDVCRGLIHAQEKLPGLVHSDIKPENILIAQGGLAKITDFGLAQIIKLAGVDQERFEKVGNQPQIGGKGIAGTPAYMAPEQWHGEELDVRSDIYSLGCVLYEMLTGTCPYTVDFRSSNHQQGSKWLKAMQSAHESAPYPKLPAELPSNLNDLLQSCLAKSKYMRLSSFSDLMTRLTEIYELQFNQLPPTRPTPNTFAPADYTNRGITYAALKLYEKALENLGEAVVLDATYHDSYYNRGITYLSLKKYEEALADFTQVIALNPTDAQAYISRGNVYAILQKYESALTDFTRALDLDPNLVTVFCNRGNTYTALQQYDKALADYENASKVDSQHAQIYYNRGHVYCMLRKYDLAIEEFGRSIELAPMSVQAYCNRGNAYAELQQYNRALSDFDQAIKLEPTDVESHIGRGNIYVSLQQYTKALVDFDQVIAIDPTRAQAFYNRGLTYHNMQQNKQAVKDYDQAITLDPNYVMAYLNRGVSYMEMQEYKQALSDYGKAIALDNSLALAYSNRGNTYSELREYQKAIADYNKAITLDPSYSQAYYNRGNVYAALAKHEQALADYNNAIALNPGYVRAYSNRGATYAALHRDEQALADYNKAIELDPNYARAYVNLGVFLAKHGMPEKALHYYEQGAKLGLSQAAEYADDIRQWLGLERTPRINPEEVALTAFMEADTVMAMKQAVLRFPLMVEADFIVAIEQFTAQLAPPELRPALNRRLGWLREIANNQKLGLWTRLFSKRRE